MLGWAQLPSTRGRGFSLGIFPDRDHFAQVAFADTHGRVFVGTDPNMDVQDMQARFMFGKEKEVTLRTVSGWAKAASRVHVPVSPV